MVGWESFERRILERFSPRIAGDRTVLGHGPSPVWIRGIYFCSAIALLNPHGLAAAGHSRPTLGELQAGRTAGLLESLLAQSAGNVAFAISLQDLDLLERACARHGVRLEGTYRGETHWMRETGETHAYRKDLVLDPANGRAFAYENGVLVQERRLTRPDLPGPLGFPSS